MSLIFEVPKKSRFVQTANTFSGVFNSPSPGLYDFNAPANSLQPCILPINKNSVYFVDRVNIGADIPEDEFQANIVAVPQVFLSFRIESKRVYALPLPLVNYVQNQEAVAWFWTEKANDGLMISLTTGLFSQDSFLVGRGSIRIFVSFNIYEITDNNFIQQFKAGSLNSSLGFNAPLHNGASMVAGGGSASRL